MINDTQQNNSLEPIKKELPVVTVSDAKKKMELALTVAELNMQAVLNDLGALVLNEDNLVLIKEKLTLVDKIQKKIDEEHKVIKKPYKDGGDACDDAKNELKGLLQPEYNRVNAKYVAICQAKEKREREEAAEEKRKQAIREGMTTNINDFSTKIAAAETTEQLLDIERRINLEKARKDKYGEYYDEMVGKLNELTPLLTEQKKAVKELSGLDVAEQKAIETGDDESLLAISEKKETITAQVQETKIRVQETAVNQSSYSGGGGGFYTTVKSGIKPSRRTWKTELVSATDALKTNPDLLRVELNPIMVKAELEKLKASGKLKEGETEELTIGGIKYFLHKDY